MSVADATTAVVAGGTILLSAVGVLASSRFTDLSRKVDKVDAHIDEMRIDSATLDLRVAKLEEIHELTRHDHRHRMNQED